MWPVWEDCKKEKPLLKKDHIKSRLSFAKIKVLRPSGKGVMVET